MVKKIEKKCIECNLIKNIKNNFISGRHKYCNECQIIKDEKQKQRCKDYKKNNRQYIKEYNKKYKSKNKEKIKEYEKEYTATKRKTREFKDKKNKYYKNKRETDIKYKIGVAYRNRLRKFMNDTRKTNKLLGCKKDFLIEWFLYIDPKLNLNNHGKEWHIDHLIPCNLFNLKDEKELKKCFHWSNLQPLNASINMSKKDKLTFKELFFHEIKLYSFLFNKKIYKKEKNYNRVKYLSN